VDPPGPLRRAVEVLRRTPLRVRVAAAFALTTAVAILGLAVFVVLRVEQTLVDETRTSLRSRTAALASVNAERRATLVRAMTGETFGQIVSATGRVEASSARLGGEVALPRVRPAAGAAPVLFERDVLLAGEEEAETAELLATEMEGDTVVVGSSREHVEEALDQVVTQLLVAGPLALLAATLVGYWVAGAALRPVEAMRARAETISGTVGDRLPLPAADDEIRRLGVTLNDMLDRLDASLTRERRFVAEASHELRTPLALLRLEVDLATSRSRTTDELRAALVSVQEEVDRLSALTDDLLMVSGNDGRHDREGQDVDLAELTTTTVARFTETARALGRVVRVDVADPAWVHGDRSALERVVANLVDNALRHGSGPVVVSTCRQGLSHCLCVTDDGPAHGERLDEDSWDAFTRAAYARPAGHGLGLTIVRSVVEQHGGAVGVDATEDGTRIRVLLPATSQHG
jgi:signal transduction histidine kinase